MAMDRTEALRSSVDVTDDAFHQSLARLSEHLASRRSTLLLSAPPPAPRRQWKGWPFLLIAVVAAATAGYHYAAFTDGDLMRIATSSTAAEAASTLPAPTPVAAAIAVAREPAVPSATDTLTKTKEAMPVAEAAAVIPAPPPADTPPPVAAADPPADIALTWAEILEVQKRLASLGINPGPLDGIAGPRTIGAVQRYEELHGRAVAGKIDRRLLKVLQQDSAAPTALEARAP
jgi:hypothetical protein